MSSIASPRRIVALALVALATLWVSLGADRAESAATYVYGPSNGIGTINPPFTLQWANATSRRIDAPAYGLPGYPVGQWYEATFTCDRSGSDISELHFGGLHHNAPTVNSGANFQVYTDHTLIWDSDDYWYGSPQQIALGLNPTCWARLFLSQVVRKAEVARTWWIDNPRVVVRDIEAPFVTTLGLTGTWINAATPTWTLDYQAWDNFDASGIGWHRIRRDGVDIEYPYYAAECYPSCTRVYSTAGLTDGLHPVYVYVDGDNVFGAPGVSATYNLYVDKTAPIAKITASAFDASGTRFKVAVDSASDAMSGVASWSLRNPAGVQIATNTSPASALENIDLSAWDGQNVAFQIVVSDLAGNSATYASNTVSVRSRAGATFPVSASASGTSLGGNGASVSDDGRYMAFLSSSSSVVAGDANGAQDAFVLDRQLGTTQRVSVSSAGVEANGATDAVAVSGDGRFVAFVSSASNLVASDANGAKDVFLYDIALKTTTRVSVTTAGAEANGASERVALSADGRYVAFASAASNLVASDTNAAQDVFIRDRVGSVTERVSVGASAVQATGASGPAFAMSADGRYVVFASSASNLVSGDANGQPDIFRRDRNVATTERISVRTGGAEAAGASMNPGISADGRFVVFASDAANLDAAVADTNGRRDVFVRDLSTGLTERVSYKNGTIQAGVAGTEANHPAISADGRYVTYSSDFTDLVVGDSNAAHDVFLRDRTASTTLRMSVASEGDQGTTAASAVSLTAITPNARYVVFDSTLEGIAGTNNTAGDVFFVDRSAGPVLLQSSALPVPQTLGVCDNNLGTTSASGCDGQDEVNGATGGFSDSFTDIALPGVGLAFEFTRFYNSQGLTLSTRLSSGWRHRYETRVDNTGTTVKVTAEDGQVAEYKDTGGGTYQSPPGVRSRLSWAGGIYTLTALDGSYHKFDASGRVIEMRNERHQGLVFGYDGSSRLTTITDSASRSIALTYTVSGQVDRVTLPDGRYVDYDYNASGQLSSVRDLLGGTTAYTYTATTNGRIASITTPRGTATTGVANDFVTSYAYDGTGRMQSKTDAAGTVTTYGWTAATQTSTRTVAASPSRTWTEVFSNNVPIREIDPLGNVTEFGYDHKLRRTYIKNPKGHVTRYAYDANGDQTEVVRPHPFTYPMSSTYNAQNKLLTERDHRGFLTTYEYNGLNELIKKTDALGGFESYTYTTLGQLWTETDERGKTTTHEYDPAGNRITTTTAAGAVSRFEYDSSGRMIASVDPRGEATPAADYRTTYAYDAGDNRTRVTDPRGNSTFFSYDANENRIATTSPDAPTCTTGTQCFNGRISTVAVYDALDRLTSVTDARGAVTQTELNRMGSVTATVEPNGQRTEHTYDLDEQRTATVSPRGVATTADPNDFKTQFSYDANGNLTVTTNPLGQTTANTYDALDRVVAVTDGLNKTRRTSFDAEGNVIATIEPSGDTSTTTYDALERAVSTTTARGKTTTMVYDAAGNLAKRTAPAGGITTFCYDDDSRLTSTVEPRGNTPTESTCGATNTFRTTFSYYENGLRRTITTPLGHTTESLYDQAGNLSEVKDANLRSTLFTYDPVNRLASVTGPDAPACTTGAECVNLKKATVYVYDVQGNLTSRTNPNAHVTTNAYDFSRRLTQTQSAIGQKWTFEYDADDNQVKQVTARGNTTATPDPNFTITKSYDQLGRLSAVDYGGTTTPDVTAVTYDAAGRKTGVTDGAGAETYGYDQDDQLKTVTRGGESFSYDYDPDGNVTARTYPDATNQAIGYDNDGRVASIASGGSTTTFTYDAAGNLATTTLPTANGTVETRSYDNAGRLTRVNNTKGAATLVDVTRTLDPVGNPTLITTTRPGSAAAGPVASYNFDEGSGTTLTDRSGNANTGTLVNGPTWNTSGRYGGALQFDGTNDRVSVADSNSLDLTTAMTVEAWVYPTGGTTTRTILEKEATGSLSYGVIHDGSRRPDGRIRNANGTQSAKSGTALALNTWTHVAATYDGTTVRLYTNGTQVATRSTTGPITVSTGVLSIGGNGVRTTEWFQGRIDDVRIYNRALTATEIQTDRNTAVTTTAPGGTTNEAYQYDPADRLTKACLDTTTCTGATKTITWTYDPVGNRLTQVRANTGRNDGTETSTYNAADQLTQVVKSVGGTTLYTYDADGNQITEGAKTYAYDLENRLISLTNGATTTTYTHDANDKRLTRATNGTIDTKYAWDTVGVIPELALERTNANALIRRYIQSPMGPLSLTTPTGTSYYHRDFLGSIRTVTSATGTEEWRYDYDPYGEERTTTQLATGAPTNPARFTGEYLNPESGDYHLRAREYDPDTGRFQAMDPVDGALNDPYTSEYVYVEDRPLVLIDPTGEFGWGDIGRGIKKVGGVAYDVSGAKNVVNAGRAVARGDIKGVATNLAAVTPIGRGVRAVKAGQAVVSVARRSDSAAASAPKSFRWDKPAAPSAASDSRAGKPFTPRGKQTVIDRNRAQNGGVTRCEYCARTTIPAQRSQRGVRPPDRETQVDHVIARSRGGSGSPPNGVVACRSCNIRKGNGPAPLRVRIRVNTRYSGSRPG